MKLIGRTHIDVDDPFIRLLEYLSNLTDFILQHGGSGISAESNGESYQDRTRTEVQSGDLFQVGDAVDPSKCLFQPLHDDRRDRLACDQATGFVGQNQATLASNRPMATDAPPSAHAI